jgi:hypothetical protein
MAVAGSHPECKPCTTGVAHETKTGMKLNLGFSPCPNDTFIFDALVNGHIDTEALQFEPVLEDVETLNAGQLKANWTSQN